MPSPRSSKLGKMLAVAAACSSLAAYQTSAAQSNAAGSEEQYRAAGIFDTGLIQEMPEDANCPGITSGFADPYNRSGRLRREYSPWLFHTGTDWGLPEGTPILAIADGRVIDRRDDGPGSATGRLVVVEHDLGRNDISAGYAHLSDFNVEVNQKVKRGQIIGFVGSTGKGVTYPHLHLSIYGARQSKGGSRKLRYRYDYLQLLSGDMTRIDPVKKRSQKVKVAYMDPFGKVHPAGATVIWPFVCERISTDPGAGTQRR